MSLSAPVLFRLTAPTDDVGRVQRNGVVSRVGGAGGAGREERVLLVYGRGV